MPDTTFLRADHHVHSTFSDGHGTLRENLHAAQEAGLVHIGFVDHVRARTPWLPAYAAAVRRLVSESELTVTSGIEAKILDLDGRLDLPRDLSGIDRIVAADHQVPGPTGPIHPDVVGAAIRGGTYSAARIIDDIVTATEAAMGRRDRLLLAHLFSILPKVGLSEEDVSELQIERLAQAAAESGATLEISERWRCPSARVVEVFRDAGVEIVASSDAHEPCAIGRYEYVADLAPVAGAEALAGAVR